MLAWIFWHSRSSATPEAEYRTRLLEFHELLYGGEIDGFLGSRICRYPAVPWLPSPTEVYEDWYFLRDSAALDRLDEAALDLHRQARHDAVARLASVAAAGLYRLRAGSDPATIARCYWMSKPLGETYDRFFARYRDRDPQSFGLWGRQMVLGPTPEFVLTTAEVPDSKPENAIELVPEIVAPKRPVSLRPQAHGPDAAR